MFSTKAKREEEGYDLIVDFYSVLLKSRGLGVFLYLSACAPSPSALEFIVILSPHPHINLVLFLLKLGAWIFLYLSACAPTALGFSWGSECGWPF